MAIDEGSRHDMFNGLEEVLGKVRATVLMEHLPPVGWADVATKHDLEQLEVSLRKDLSQLETRFDARFEVMEQKLLATFRAELVNQTRTMIIAMSTLLVSVVGLLATATRLL